MSEKGQKALELDNRLIDLLERGVGIAKRYADAGERPPQMWFDKLDELLTGTNEWKRDTITAALNGELDRDETLEIMRNQTRQRPLMNELLRYCERWLPPDHPLLS